jgi:hypothetical protein
MGIIELPANVEGLETHCVWPRRGGTSPPRHEEMWQFESMIGAIGRVLQDA